MNKTGIQYVQYTWNPMHGCTKISEGCSLCYAEKMSKRLAAMGIEGYDKADAFKVAFSPEKLDEPTKVKKPSNIFVASMGDLFHEDTTYSQWLDVYDVMRENNQHNYLLLTKRSTRMMQRVAQVLLPNNIWLGVTAENQQRADERIPDLIATGHDSLFVSLEPLLGPIDITPYMDKLKWVIVGAESGAGRRPCDYAWVLDVIKDCANADVPVFYKQGPGDECEWCKEPYVFFRQYLELPDALKANVEAKD